MAVFVLTFDRGPEWDPVRSRREQAGWDAHAAFMDGLVGDGFVLLGGPLGDDGRAMVIAEALDPHEVRDRFADDPWLVSPVLRLVSIERWAIWLDARRTAS